MWELCELTRGAPFPSCQWLWVSVVITELLALFLHGFVHPWGWKLLLRQAQELQVAVAVLELQWGQGLSSGGFGSSSSVGHEWSWLERGVWRGHWNQALVKGSTLQMQCRVCLLKPELQRNQCSQRPCDLVSWGKTSKQTNKHTYIKSQKAKLTFPPHAPDPELGAVFVAENGQKTVSPFHPRQNWL